MAIKILSGIDVIGDMNITAADVPALDASKISTGAFDAARIPNLPASKITSGAFDIARIPDLSSLYASSTITLADLGYTGDTNANYITNNNQLTNGAGYLTSSNDRVYITDSRGAARAPSYYNDRYAQWDFQNQSDTGAGGDGWHSLLTVSKWSSYDNSHRQEQLIFTGNNLKRRTATSDSEWGEVKTIWDTGNLGVGDNGLTEKNFTTARADIVDSFTRNVVVFNPEPSITEELVKIGVGVADPQRTLTVDNEIEIQLTGYTDDKGLWMTYPGIEGVSTHYHSAWVKFNGNYASYSFIQNGNTRMHIAHTTGNVGIGTTTPSYKLDVNGDINIPNNSALFVDGALALTQDSASGFTSIGLGGALSVNPIQFTMTFNGADVLFGSLSNGAIPAKATFGVGDSGIVSDFPPSEVLRISSSSNVGIGVTNPSEKLEVNGNILAYGDITALSDARVKENVETLPNALKSVKAMRGVTYNKIGENKQSVGVIAQEVRAVLPQLVSEHKDGMLSVAYGNITAVLIEAVKEQQKQIDELKAQLNASSK